ncbi:MAG: diguanylate cyclase [Spirochaetia bacterium]|nr:diguanylate cyclase [Spirochaetia bacterium]
MKIQLITGWTVAVFFSGIFFGVNSLASESVDASASKVNLIPHALIIDSDTFHMNSFFLERAPRISSGERSDVVSFGFSNHAHYFLILVENPTSGILSRVLVLDPTWLDEVQVELTSGGKTVRFSGGDTVPFRERFINHRKINFELHFKPGISQLLVKTRTGDPYLVGLTLWEKSRFYEEDAYNQIYIGLVYGVLFIMLFYNLILFFAVREKMFAAYVNYILFFILMHSTYNGHLYQIFWPESPVWGNWAHSVFIFGFALSGIVFASVFLELKKRLRNYYKMTVGFGFIIVFLFIITAAAGGYSLHVRTSILSVFVYTPFVLFIGIGSLLSGNRAARLFLTAAIAGFIGSFITALTVTGLIPFTFYFYHAVDFGMLIDAVLLSLAMAERVRYSKKEADTMKEQLLDMNRTHAEKLEREISERTYELQRINSKLLELSLIDPLTNIGNRRRLDDFLQREWPIHAREGKPISFLFCDVDYFKKYNDCFGHQAGDECLKMIALTLRSVVTRPADLIARYGGEEFAAVLSDTDESGVYYVAEKIRKRIESLQIPHPDSFVSNFVTISLGFSTSIPSEDFRPDDLIRQADEALYAAKQQGRNRSMGFVDIKKK